MNTPRTPKQCIEAVLANLEMVREGAARNAQITSRDWPAHTFHKGQLDVLGQIRDLIRTECASFLTTETKESTHA